MGLPGRVAFFVSSSVPLCIWETGWERLGPYRRAYAPFPFFCPYFSFLICISPRFVVSLHRQRKHACVSFFHFSSPSLPPKPGNGVPSWLNEPMKRSLLDDRLGRMRILMGRMRKTRRIKTGGRMGVEKSRVSLFLNLNKFRAILWYCSPCSDPQPHNLGGLGFFSILVSFAICLLPVNCADYTNSSSQSVFALFAQFVGKWLCLRMTRVIVSVVFALTRNAKKSVIPLFFARFSVTLYANFDF